MLLLQCLKLYRNSDKTWYKIKNTTTTLLLVGLIIPTFNNINHTVSAKKKPPSESELFHLENLSIRNNIAHTHTRRKFSANISVFQIGRQIRNLVFVFVSLMSDCHAVRAEHARRDCRLLEHSNTAVGNWGTSLLFVQSM